MPAVNPERLVEEVKEVQGLIGNPSRLRWRVVEILEFYSDRIKRSQATLRSGHADKKYGVPRPVLHALERGLKQSLSDHPELSTAILEEFWGMDYRETRYLAIKLLEIQPLEDVLRVAETWSVEMKDRELLGTLAQTLVSSWRIVYFQDFSQMTSKWLHEKRTPLKSLAMATLRSAVDDPGFSDLPYIFSLLKVQDIVRNVSLRRALIDLLRALIRRSEAESARFLLDILDMDASTGRKLIRALLECFSPDQRLRLKRALST